MSFAVKVTGHVKSVVDAELPALTGSLVASGITAGDASLWGAAAEDEASRRLGWVGAVSVSRPLVPQITALRDDLVAQGVTRVVLAGMGGSSLAPEVIAQSAGVPLVILDSTAPGQVLAAIDGDAESGGLEQTVLVVSSKSGSTIETDSAKRAFETAFRDVGIDPATRIVVVTDPGSPLEQSARVSPELDAKPDDLQVVRFVDDADAFHLFERHTGEVLVSGSLGAQFVVWEYATAIAGRMLGIDPFDQPDVESAKEATRGLLEAQPVPTAPAFVADGVEVRVSDPALAESGTVEGVLAALWARVPADGYVSVQAYVNRLDLAQLSGLRELVAADTGRPTTFGWGPRFLHSTGQYHKGGPATGVFLQIIERTDVDLEIPGRPFTFGQLIQAQAAGDASVLAEAHGRPVVTLTLTDPQVEVLSLFEAAQ